MSDELLSRLLECFPEVDFELLAHASRVNHSREDAIDFILASQAAPGRWSIDIYFFTFGVEPIAVDPGQSLLAQLIEVFPELPIEDLSAIVDARTGDQSLEDLIDDVIVQHGAYEAEPETEGMSWAEMVKSRPARRKQVQDTASGWQFSFKTDSYQVEQEEREFQRKNGPFVYKLFAELERPAEHDMDPVERRQEICELLALRKEYYAKATDYFNQGGLTGTQSSQFYAEKGRRLETEIERLKIESSYRIYLKKYPAYDITIISTFCSNPEPYSRRLDLHFLTVDEAIPILDAFLEHHIGDEETIRSPVQVITGAGNHSLPTVGPKLRPAVWRRLSFSSYRFSYDGHAVFTVYGKMPRRERRF